MSVLRVIQISDTHLGREKSWFVPNFEAIGRIVAAEAPDMIINTGDISLDGAAREDDLVFARACHDELDIPVRAIPGNHDVGDNPWGGDNDTVITEERLARYRRHFGNDFWLVDAGRWVLVGVNAQLLGSGLRAEDEQWALLASVPTDGRLVAVFIHKPLFDRHPAELDVNQRYVTPENRRRLQEVLGGAELRLVASGHVHQHRRQRVADVEHCWAPSTAYVLPDWRQPRVGHKRVGYVDYRFRPERVDITIVEAAALTNHDLDDFPLAYAD